MPTGNMTPPSYADVVDAAQYVNRVARVTPLLNHPIIDELVGAPVYVKCEPLQVTGSFKIRGAVNRISRLTAEERKNGVVAFSSGNHAQGVARAARLEGIKARIVMPRDTPNVKIDGVKRDGAEIIFYDRATEDREAISEKIAEAEGCVIVPSYNDPHIIAGQGTCGLEIVEQFPLETPPQALVCCIGGGGLIAGVSLAVRESWPGTRIYGSEPVGYDSTGQSLRAGHRVGIDPTQKSICDALMSPSPGEMTFAINSRNLSGGVAVADDEVLATMKLVFSALKIVVEPGGAAALAALIYKKVPVDAGKPVVAILTGGNVDPGRYVEALSLS